ncbi:hypothetical protein [Mycobacterium sp. UM_CSW]|uniref:hypothetical protein n=1 Tax=Mycobacterium sp. UM_CSW TaxID=1370119 RepID=UPI00041C6382|nr:hypothetical protein [Mycobacterium sp. UM_CSW]
MWDDGFLPLDECAARMGVTVERVQEYVRRGTLRADRDGYVQPAILSGAVDDGDSSP